jgi:hypothetical protein
MIEAPPAHMSAAEDLLDYAEVEARWSPSQCRAQMLAILDRHRPSEG